MLVVFDCRLCTECNGVQVFPIDYLQPTWNVQYVSIIYIYRIIIITYAWFRAVEYLGGKTLVMNLVNHGNSDVKMQALLAIQKMMVQNW